jgi:uncharacterized protein YukE
MTDVGILGGDAVRGDADALTAVAGFMRSVAHDLHDVRTTLERHAFAEVWEGTAAEAFRELLRETPDDLQRAERSYDMASQAVSTYAGHLRDARATAQSLADRLAALERQSAQLAGSHRTAELAVGNGRYAVSHATDPAAHSSALRVLDDRLRALAGLQSQRGSVDAQIDAIRRQARANRRALDAAAQVAGDQVIQASHAGIRNSLGSWWDRHNDVLVTIGKGTLEVLKSAVQVFVDAVEFFPRLIAFLKDPSWKNLSEVLNDLSAVLTVLATIAFVAGVFLSGGALLAALPAVIAGLKVAGTLVDTTKLAVDAYRRKSGDTSVTDVELAVDAAAIGLHLIGGRADAKASGKWIGALADPSNSNAWKTWAAKCVIKGEGKNLSWAEIGAIKAVPLIIKEVAEDRVEAVIEDQAKDLGDKYLPGIGRPDAQMPGWMQTAATRVKHTITVPRIEPIMPLPLVAR